MSQHLVPFLDLQTQFRSIRQEILAALEPILDSQSLILGPEVLAFEREMAEYCGVPFAIAVANGTDALYLALKALEIGPGDEVITSSYSFFATAGAILHAGAKPVFADIEAHTFNIDPDSVARLIGPRTRALMPVHLYGQCADMDRLQALASSAGIPIVEDAAQAIGARWDHRRAGSMGRLGCFSFYPTKNLGGIGDGGMITTSDPQLEARLRALRNHGQTGQYEHRWLGLNSRLDALNAAALRVKLRYLDRWTESRRALAAQYRTLLESAPLQLPQERPQAFHVYNQFVVRIAQRDAIRSALQQAGVGSAIYYPMPIPHQPNLAGLDLRSDAIPQAIRASQETLALPIYPELTLQQQQQVAQALLNAIPRPSA